MSKDSIEIRHFEGTIKSYQLDTGYKIDYSLDTNLYARNVVTVTVERWDSAKRTFITNSEGDFKVGDEVSLRYKIDHASVRKESEIITMVHGLDVPLAAAHRLCQ